MVWTDYHDILLCREILAKNPFQFKKSSTQRGQVWLEIATNLSCIREPKFKTDLDQRAVRERYNLLSTKLRRKLSSEEKASGIDPDMSEVEDMVEELIQIEDDLAERRRLNDEENKRKAEVDKENANDIRVKAMEKLGETKRRKENEAEVQKKDKRRRSNGSETIQYLREKNELMIKFRMEDKELEKQKQNEERNKHDEFMKMMMQQQQQFQAMIMQQQQQQNQLMMAVISKLGSK